MTITNKTTKSKKLNYPDVRLAVIMPVYGNWEDTLNCLGMLAEQSSCHFKLFLVDDGSPDPAPDSICTFPFVTYLRRQHAGFAAACNAGVREAVAQECTHVLLLNNDTAFGREFIANWLAKISAFPRAILAPIIYYYDQPELIWYSGGKHSIVVPFIRLQARFPRQTKVDILTGCVLLVPTQIWQQLNGLDESYVTYFEDLDMMLRARKMRISAYVVIEPELSVRHKVSRTALRSGRWSREYRMMTSRLLFIRRHYSGLEKFVCLLGTIPLLCYALIRNLPLLPDPRRVAAALQAGLC